MQHYDMQQHDIQYYDIHHYDMQHYKMQCMFTFYLQIFTAVHCGFLVLRGRCSIGKRFRPKSS
jgi:hypothetical protein